MLAVVKKLRTKKPELEVRGKTIPAWLIDGLRRNYGDKLVQRDVGIVQTWRFSPHVPGKSWIISGEARRDDRDVAPKYL